MKKHSNLSESRKKKETLDDEITLTVVSFGTKDGNVIHITFNEKENSSYFVIGYIKGILKEFEITKEAYNRLINEYFCHPLSFAFGIFEFTLSKKDIINEI
jgi:phenylpyruvate tautomerase PptA (4-oxalocrotonate tautomerase family)